jgi:hypothetical protein
MSGARAVASVTDVNAIKIRVDSITKACDFNKLLNRTYKIKLSELKIQNDTTLPYDGVIRSNIKKLVDAITVLNKVNELSNSIQASLNEVYMLKGQVEYIQNRPYDISIPSFGEERVNITPAGGVSVKVDASPHLSVASSPPLNTSQTGELNRKPDGGDVLLMGGSKTNQVGGRGEAYTLPPNSPFYITAVTELKPLTPENNPEFYDKLKEAILNKTIQPVSAATTTKYEPSHDTPLSPAAQSAKNPNVIKNLIMNLNAKTEDAQTSIIKKYEDLVMMCDKITALELIKPLLKPKQGETIPSDTKLLTMLGWNGNDNELLYDINKRRKGGGGVFIQGLFSFFCFDNDKFSVGFSRHCGKNYMCMLNWVIIVAFRLKMRDPDIYTDALIIKLIENMHHALWLKDTNLDNFTKKTGDNAGLYIVGAKTSMNNGIFNYGDLRVLVKGIKGEVQKIPEPSSSGGSKTHNTTHKLSHKNVKGGNKVTTRKHHHRHRHPTIHNVGHTVKVAQKPTDVNTIKTRRIHHTVKT